MCIEYIIMSGDPGFKVHVTAMHTIVRRKCPDTHKVFVCLLDSIDDAHTMCARVCVCVCVCVCV